MQLIHSLLALAAALGTLACGDEPATAAGSAAAADQDAPLPQVAPSQYVKAIWVTRFDYASEADIAAVLDNVTEAGFNTVMWQVRGNATAFYDSPYEPWAEQLGGGDPTFDPGFDPLAVAVAGARERGLSLHAWVNLMPAWWGLEPPANPQQLYNAHPEWLWVDQFGQQQPLSDKFYVSVNPCLPEVRAYLTDVVVDIARRYAVEGIHLDYVRFPKEFPGTPKEPPGIDYPRDARTLALFTEALAEAGVDVTAAGLAGGVGGGAGGDVGGDVGADVGADVGGGFGRGMGDGGEALLALPGIAEKWDQWRTNAVTETVRDIAAALDTLERPPLLSAAVKATPGGGLEFHQDAETWTQESLVGAVFPMNYAREPEPFTQRNAAWMAELDAQRARNEADTPGVANPFGFQRTPLCIVGVWGGDDDPVLIQDRIRRALNQADGVCLFAYAFLFDSVNAATADQNEAESAKRARRRQTLVPFFRDL